jgi:hypothetical protein
MNEPKRLLDSRSGHLRALVEAGKRDLPDRHVQENVLGALGLGAAGGAGLTAGASVRLARSGTSRFLHGLSRAALSKVGIAVIVTATASSAGYLAGSIQVPLRPSAPDPRTASMPIRPSTVSAAATSPTSPPPAATPVPQFRAREPNARAGAAPATRAHAPHDALPADEAHETKAVPSMTAQLESIRRVHALVAAGDAGAALLELDAYETRCPHGSFEEEAIALRVRALRVAGDAAGAERARRNLQSRFPRSVHLAKLGK